MDFIHVINGKQVVIIYDHNEGETASLTKAAATIANTVKIEAVLDVKLKELVTTCNEMIVLVAHMGAERWNTILENAGLNEKCVLVRCSTDALEYSDMPKEGRPLILALRFSLSEDFVRRRILEKMFVQISKEDNINQLRTGHVPEALQEFFRFRFPGIMISLLLIAKAVHTACGQGNRNMDLLLYWKDNCKGKGDTSHGNGTTVIPYGEPWDSILTEGGIETGEFSAKLPKTYALRSILEGGSILGKIEPILSELIEELRKQVTQD